MPTKQGGGRGKKAAGSSSKLWGDLQSCDWGTGVEQLKGNPLRVSKPFPGVTSLEKGVGGMGALRQSQPSLWVTSLPTPPYPNFLTSSFFLPRPWPCQHKGGTGTQTEVKPDPTLCSWRQDGADSCQFCSRWILAPHMAPGRVGVQ